MHETGIVRDLVHRIVDAAAQAGAHRVDAVHVWIGALSAFSSEHFREHFEDEVRGTLAENAALHLETSDDASHPDAQHVVLKRLSLDVPDEADVSDEAEPDGRRPAGRDMTGDAAPHSSAR